MPFSPLASPAATRAALESHGLHLKKSLGQHFLIDDNIVAKILELARIPHGSPVLEVGPGIGTLTAALCSAAGHVVAVERDADLLPALEDVSDRCGNLTVVRADAVSVSLGELDTPLGPPSALVANLPYGVAATVVLRFFEEFPSMTSATVMVQREVADRMAAEPGRKDYGSYSVKLRLLSQPAGRFAVARTCFMPPPRVDSAVLRLERIERPEPAHLLVAAARLADAAFAQRRKTLRNSVLASTGWSGALFDEALSATGIDGRRRAETLSVDEYLELARETAARGL
ncbi:MAG: 16S rRNA (adenine(1518)-N(6)/adenine(1519)-N(6))-dimethyltransferase RsmA [Coriobacteriia bacterium]|nr:16S rRNA (adenine(1518)-N(6)/adenine(1519)-N(6))-dimethyltransferase RsmA [Coriobacteriia bacterium]